MFCNVIALISKGVLQCWCVVTPVCRRCLPSTPPYRCRRVLALTQGAFVTQRRIASVAGNERALQVLPNAAAGRGGMRRGQGRAGPAEKSHATHQLILIGCHADENRLRKYERPEFLSVEILNGADVFLTHDVNARLVFVH